eukprot:1685365-Lingulodinium_polyedra.AAC.1
MWQRHISVRLADRRARASAASARQGMRRGPGRRYHGSDFVDLGPGPQICVGPAAPGGHAVFHEP